MSRGSDRPKDGRPVPSSDAVDPRRARQYAWRLPDLLPVDDVAGDAAEERFFEEGAELTLEAEALDERVGLEQSRREAAEACQRLEVAIERTLAIEDPALQARSTAHLTAQAADLGPQLLALDAGPSVGLLRLIARHRGHETRGIRQATRGVLLWLELSHPEVARILLEVARAGDRALADELAMALSFRSEHPLKPAPGVGAHLADLLDRPGTRTQRLIALQWLELGCFPEAIPSLKRVLREPDLVVRWRALHALDRTAHHRAPLGRERSILLGDDDVLFLLDDAIAHPLPPLEGRAQSWELDEAICAYGQQLHEVTVARRPPGGAERLLAIIEGRCVHDGRPHRVLDASWALQVLAAAYPAAAVEVLDRLALHAREDLRLSAARAAGQLPEEEARPRLLRLAADGAAAVATTARDAWLECFQSRCPVQPDEELDLGELEGPPGEVAVARLIALRGPAECLPQMAEVLLGEAPSRESLALLLVALGNTHVARPGPRRQLPASPEDWAEALLRRFGDAGFAGLLRLARRYAVGSHGWLAALAEVLRTPSTRALLQTPERRARLQDLARDLLLEHGEHTDRHAALAILERAGTPAELTGLLLGMTDDELLAHAAAMALAGCPADSGLDARLVAEAERARHEVRWSSFTALAQAAFARGLPDGLRLMETLLADADRLPGDAAVEDALEMTTSYLRHAGALTDERLLEWLADPTSRRFSLAAGQVLEMEGRRGSRFLAAVEPVVGSPARGGASSASAAAVVVSLRPGAARQRHWPQVAAAASSVQRSVLIHELLARKAPRRPLFPLLAELLVQPPSLVTVWARASLVHYLRDRAYHPALRALLPRVTDEDVRESIRLSLRVTHPSATYWQHHLEGREPRRRSQRSPGSGRRRRDG
jgi:hypothetical protein